jgi:hypothetical protein
VGLIPQPTIARSARPESGLASGQVRRGVPGSDSRRTIRRIRENPAHPGRSTICATCASGSWPVPTGLLTRGATVFSGRRAEGTPERKSAGEGQSDVPDGRRRPAPGRAWSAITCAGGTRVQLRCRTIRRIRKNPFPTRQETISAICANCASGFGTSPARLLTLGARAEDLRGERLPGTMPAEAASDRLRPARGVSDPG